MPLGDTAVRERERVRLARMRRGVRIRISEQANERNPRIHDVDSGEELTNRIAIEYAGRLKYAKAGSRVRFVAYLRNAEGRVILAGDRAAREVILADVVEATA